MNGSAKVHVDALVRGLVGATQVETEMRVYRVAPYGWVAGISADGKQHIMYHPEVIGPPRPEKQRTNIPAGLL